MPAHPNAQLVHEGFQAFATGDLATLQRLFHEDVVWHSPGDSPLSGNYRGLQEIAKYLGMFAHAGMRAELHDVTASDDHAVALFIDHVEQDGAPVTKLGGIVFNIDGGRVREAWAFNLDQTWHDEFWRAAAAKMG